MWWNCVREVCVVHSLQVVFIVENYFLDFQFNTIFSSLVFQEDIRHWRKKKCFWVLWTAAWKPFSFFALFCCTCSQPLPLQLLLQQYIFLHPWIGLLLFPSLFDPSQSGIALWGPRCHWAVKAASQTKKTKTWTCENSFFKFFFKKHFESQHILRIE